MSDGRIEIYAPFNNNPHGRWYLPGAGKTEWFKEIEAGPEMVLVPAGKFLMGSPESEPQREASKAGTESPKYPVTIPKPFAVGRCAVTRGQFAAFVAAMGYNAGKKWRDPGFAQDDSHPVVWVNWEDAQAFVTWLSRVTGAAYRLPSEMEWEYVCRAGTVTPFWWGSAITTDQANYNGNTYAGDGSKGEWRKRTVPAKSFEANPWGLYQVHGNVWEWCALTWHDSYAGKPEDLKRSWEARGGSRARTLRGGSWCLIPSFLRAAYRSQFINPEARSSDIGFRVARTIIP